ncbi:Thioesterase (plasmid) [Candidatus Trichorickettsia mobilis]|jgi:medium-chain acyl-[acyl-carrier-protein] hydrolase|uniref:thioesterase II family protein n=1 Tax=Candidatus Trichorickettsia mobilis TaxID=1346319 RepID=UPI002B2642D4|nr:alpha/beta fold hydrolase [Candidatus Trichorickettsia mobilis]WPY01820.1 Thioesterase [Candidatus Trichorickettsia mobilis]
MSRCDDWFIPFKQEKNAYVRLFCFHYGGGSATTYREWTKGLIEHVELVAIQLPGREHRFSEPLLYNISHVVDKLCENFSSYIGKPFVFFGHSIGALIAFEFVRTLRRKGMPQPKHLIISGAKAPQVALKRAPIYNLTDSKLIEEIRKYNGIPISILEDEELMAIFLPIIRADFFISETYKYTSEEPLTFPITSLGGLGDDTFDFEDLLKWKEQTSSSFEYNLLPGDHFFIRSSYQKVIRIVNQILYHEIVKFISIN